MNIFTSRHHATENWQNIERSLHSIILSAEIGFKPTKLWTLENCLRLLVVVDLLSSLASISKEGHVNEEQFAWRFLRELLIQIPTKWRRREDTTKIILAYDQTRSSFEQNIHQCQVFQQNIGDMYCNRGVRLFKVRRKWMVDPGVLIHDFGGGENTDGSAIGRQKDWATKRKDFANKCNVCECTAFRSTRWTLSQGPMIVNYPFFILSRFGLLAIVWRTNSLLHNLGVRDNGGDYTSKRCYAGASVRILATYWRS